MQSTSFAVNPLAPRPAQTTTHTVTETAVAGPAQVQSHMSYQQYAQPTTQYTQQGAAQYFQQQPQGASQYLQQSSQGATQYLQQSSQGATQYLQQPSQGVTQYLQQPSQGVTQYLQQPSQGVTQYLQQPSPGVTQYLQAPSHAAGQYLQQYSQGPTQHNQQPSTTSGQYVQSSVEYTQGPATTYTQTAGATYTQPAAASYVQSNTQYRGSALTNQASPGIQYQAAGGSSQSYGQSQLPTITQGGASYMQDAPEGQGFHSFAKAAKGPACSAFVSGPVPDATPMVTSGSTGTIIPRQQPYAFTTVTYAKTRSAAKEEVDPNFKNSYLNAQPESHAIRERPVHPMPAKASSAGCC